MRQVAKRIADTGIEAIAVALIHAYANPAHEQRIGAILAELYPGISVSLSSAVSPEAREYERTSTTIANAYVQPLMAGYLKRLQRAFTELGYTRPIHLMTSGGSLASLETAAQFPVRLVESGPAGGAILAGHIALERGESRILSFDMGGTTAKICLIDNGQPLKGRAFEVDRQSRFKKGSGTPLRIPVIEMVEIGAGGGSIARIDALQRIQVGPDSAGAEPGPACYGRGGREPTVTDADVAIGKIDIARFAGGKIALHPDQGGGRPRRDASRACRPSRVPSASPRSSTRTWPMPPACMRWSAASPSPSARSLPSAVPRPCTPAGSPRSSPSAKSSCRPMPASVRPSASSPHPPPTR